MLFPIIDDPLFTDRDEEVNLLKTLVLSAFELEKNADAKERVLHLIGSPGVGKTTLLQKYNYYLRYEMQNVCPILVSFKDYENLSVDEFRKKTLVSFNVQITSHLGIHLLDENDITENTVKHNVEMLQKDKAVVVLIDEINVLRDELVHTLEDYVLALWLYLPRLIIVLAGRNLVTGWKDFNLRPYKGNNVVELLSFDRDNTKKQIEKLNPHAVHLAPVIYEITLGLPGNNKKILDNAIGNPLQIVENDAVRVCNQELYDAVDVVGRNLSDKKNLATELLPALEALCVLQDFDKEYEMPVLLAAHKTLEGIWNVKRCATLLSILTSIQIGPGKLIDWDKNKNAFAIVEQNRRSLEQELKIRDKKMWEVLHDTAMKMYSKWAIEYNSDIFAKKTAYHKSMLE